MESTEVQVIDLARAVEILQNHKDKGNGTIFMVEFVKRTTGEIRQMICRFDVKSYLKGGPAAYDFAEKGLMCVFDTRAEQTGGYRTINLGGILRMKVAGTRYEIRRD